MGRAWSAPKGPDASLQTPLLKPIRAACFLAWELGGEMGSGLPPNTRMTP